MAARNDWFKAEYCLDMHQYGRGPGYYRRHLKERNIMRPRGWDRDEEYASDYICCQLLQDTLRQVYLPADEIHPVGNGASGQ